MKETTAAGAMSVKELRSINESTGARPNGVMADGMVDRPAFAALPPSTRCYGGQNGAKSVVKKSVRTVRTVKSAFAHFAIGTCCRPMCSNRNCRQAFYGL
jgi:hypothetical protein